jgi:hypothetical protein
MLSVPDKQYMDIYLQGEDGALEFGGDPAIPMVYYVARHDSGIIVRDHRPDTQAAAIKAIQGENPDLFVDVFNQPAWVEVRSEGNDTVIEIEDGLPESTGSRNTLWLGLIDNGRMTAHKTHWEIIRPIKDQVDVFAFAAVVE